MAKRPRIYGKRIASTHKNMICTWSAALNTNHLPTLEAYLKDAVDSEQYELASQVRDRIREVIATKSQIERDFPGIITVEPPY